MVKCYYFCKNVITMKRVGYIQPGIRMEKTLLEQLKKNAKREHRSLNTYVVEILRQAAGPVFPHLDKDRFVIDDDLSSMGTALWGMCESAQNTNQL